MAEKKGTIAVDISKESDYCLPSQTPLAGNISIQPFFQYIAANTSDSPLSARLDEILTDADKDDVWQKMLDAVGADDNDFVFNSILRNKIQDIQALGLSDTTLVCDKVKGFIHQNAPDKNGNNSQHKLDAFLKRVRDAFAHGRVAAFGEYLIFEDKVKQLTGRIIVTVDVLEKWMKILEDAISGHQK